MSQNAATLLSAYSTLAIALLTFFLAVFTGALLVENSRLRLGGLTPYVVAYLRPDTENGMMATLVIANVGRGPAFDLCYKLNLEPSLAVQKRVAAPLNIREPSLGVLPQDDSICIFFGSFVELFEAPRLPAFAIELQYRNALGRKITCASFEIDIGSFANFHVPSPTEKALQTAQKGGVSLEKLPSAANAIARRQGHNLD